MNKALKWFGQWLFYSNVFISLCAIAYLCQGYLLLHTELKFDVLLILSGLSTFFTYTLIRLVAVKRISKYEPDERWDFFLAKQPLIRVVTILSGLACIALFFLVKTTVQYALLVPGIISVIYGLPLGKKFRLRDVGIIKIFLISFVWAFTGSVLPAANQTIDIFSPQVILIFVANYLFIFAITLPFDIKDQKIDAMNNVKTIPVYIGERNTYSLIMLLLFISSAIYLYVQKNLFAVTPDFSIPVSVSILLTALAIWFARNKKNNYVYFGLLDGMILLQFGLVYSYRLLLT